MESLLQCDIGSLGTPSRHIFRVIGRGAAGGRPPIQATEERAMRRLRCSPAIRAFAAVLLLVSCCWIGFPRTAGAEERARGLDQESSWNDKTIDLAKLFDAMVETVGQKFFDVALMKQVDWQAGANAARPSVLSAATADDAVRQINALLSELKTSHTGLFTPMNTTTTPSWMSWAGAPTWPAFCPGDFGAAGLTIPE
jgi:hypothetical protein